MSYFDNHVSNLRRSIGTNTNGSYYQYDYIVTKDQLVNAFLQSRNALGYPLRKQARYKDDRFIYTGEALEKDLTQALTQSIQDIENELREYIIQDIFPDIEDSLNSITVTDNKFVIPIGRMKYSKGSNLGSKLGNLLGKNLVKSVIKSMKDIFSGKTE